MVDYPYFAEIEAEYLRMTGVALQSQYDPETNTFVDKSSMPRQVALNTRIIRIVTALQYAFGDRFDLAAKIAAHDAGQPFSYDLLPVLDILKNKPAQNWYPKMKEVLAWNQYVMGEVGDHIFTINGQSTRSHGKITLIEPLVAGPFRPTEYRDIGCWSKNSNVFPYIERFKLEMDFRDPRKGMYFPIDSFDATDVRNDRYTNGTHLPFLMPVSVSSKLHVTFIEHAVSLPRTIPTLHYDTFELGRADLTMNQTAVFNYQDIEIRSGVQQLMFFCNGMHYPTDLLGWDKTASIINLKLASDVSNQNLALTSRYHCDAVTTRNYPQYCPPIHHTGNVVALTYNEVPRVKEVATEYDHLRGSITIKQDFMPVHTCSVQLVVIYKDTFLEIRNHHAFKGQDLY